MGEFFYICMCIFIKTWPLPSGSCCLLGCLKQMQSKAMQDSIDILSNWILLTYIHSFNKYWKVSGQKKQEKGSWGHKTCDRSRRTYIGFELRRGKGFGLGIGVNQKLIFTWDLHIYWGAQASSHRYSTCAFKTSS